MAREGVSASGLAKPLVDDVIATVVLVRSGASRWGYGATLTFCECGHQALGRRHGCRYVPRSCSPPRAHPPHGGSQHQSPGIGWSAPGHLRQTAHI